MAFIDTVAVAAQSGVPTLWWGPPGCGKSKTIQGLGQALEVPVQVVVGSIHEPSDFGYPKEIEGIIHTLPTTWAVKIKQAANGDMSHNGHITSILFLDELTTCPPAMQAAMLRIIAELVVGDTDLPKSCSILLAANPPELAAGGVPLSPAMANRVCHMQWELSVGDWLSGTVAGWPTPRVPILPPGWRKGIGQENALNSAFISRRQELLDACPRDGQGNVDLVKAGGAWPSQRTWEMAAILRAAAKSVNLPEQEQMSFMAGCVGQPAMIEYFNWSRALDLPDPESILADLSRLELVRRDDVNFAILNSVVAALVNDLTQERWLAAWKVIEATVTRFNKGDIAFVAAMSLKKLSNPNLTLPIAEMLSLEPILRQIGLLGGDQ